MIEPVPRLELEGNPLTPELLNKAREVNGTQKLLQILLDTLEGSLQILIDYKLCSQ